MLLAPPALPAPPPRAASLAQALNALEEARRLDFGDKLPEPEVLRAHREALGSAPAVLWRALGPRDPRALLARALEAGLGSLAGDVAAEKAWARAVGQLHKGLLAAERRTGPRSLQLLPWLDALADALRLQGFETQAWRDRALRLRAAQARKADPVLERACAEAIAHRYGPWLSFRPPDVPELLEGVETLLDLWSLERDPAALTRRVAEAALPSRAHGVWHLVRRRGSPELVQRIRGLLDGLQVEALEPGSRDLADWVAAMQTGPWKASADRLALRMDARLARDAAPRTVLDRVGLAVAAGDTARAAGILYEGMMDPAHGASLEYLGAARNLLRHPHLGPAEAALRDLALRRMLDPSTRPDGELLQSWAEFLEESGDLLRAEALHRRRLGLEPGQTRGLVRNLRAQGRLDEAWVLLEGARLAQEPAPPLDLLMELLGLARDRGDLSAVSFLSRRAVEHWTALGDRAPLMPGLASVLETADDLREPALGTLRKVLDLEGPEPRSLLEALRSREAPQPTAAEVLAGLDRQGRRATREGVLAMTAQATQRATEDPERAWEDLEQVQALARRAADMRVEDWLQLRGACASAAFMAGREREAEAFLLQILEALEGPELGEGLGREVFEAAVMPVLQSWEILLHRGRYGAASALAARLRRLAPRLPRPDQVAPELERMEARAIRLARLQDLAQAEGLP